MAYYVALWNPASEKNPSSELQAVAGKGHHVGSWSCGVNKSIEVGDLIVLRRTGDGARGIVGIGMVKRGSYAESWVHNGEPGRFVDIEWEYKASDPVIDRDDPNVSGCARLWTAMCGGIQLRDDEGASIFAEVRRKTGTPLVPDTSTNDLDVFISYSRANRDIAEGLASDLRARHIKVWWDSDLYAGENFHDAILKAIDSAKAVIVIWSDAAVRSQFVRCEAQRGVDQGKLLPTHVEGFDRKNLPPEFDAIHCVAVDARGMVCSSLERLGVMRKA